MLTEWYHRPDSITEGSSQILSPYTFLLISTLLFINIINEPRNRQRRMAEAL